MSTSSIRPPHRIALITGASSGIGAASARALQQVGFKVYGTYRRKPTQLIQGVEYLACDVTHDDSVNEAVKAVLGAHRRIDLLVNNAGVGLVAGAEESSIEQAKAIFDVNLFGAIRATQAVLPTMRKQRSGRIVNISSLLGLIPSPYSALYASTKHAMEGYFESLDHEVRTLGVRAVLVEPAYTRTPFENNVLQPDQKSDAYAAARQRAEAHWKTVQQDADTPELIADVVLRAATDINPRLRYTAGGMAKRVSLLRRFVPASAFDPSLRKQMGL